MTDMVERVARAMFEADAARPEAFLRPPTEAESAEHWRMYGERYLSRARVAIAAMWEPTEKMVLAAINTRPKDLPLGASIPTARWRAMIAAALKD